MGKKKVHDAVEAEDTKKRMIAAGGSSKTRLYSA